MAQLERAIGEPVADVMNRDKERTSK
jgi:hypothetical protein